MYFRLPVAGWLSPSKCVGYCLATGSRRLFFTYSFAVIAVILSLLLREYLQFWLKQDAPLLVFLMSVIFSAWYGGAGPGILATVLGGSLGTYYFIEPTHSFYIVEIADRIRVCLFGIEGFAFSFAIGATKQALGKLKTTIDELILAKKAEEEAIRTKTMFLSSLTHEIRTPLGAIMGNVELINAQDLKKSELEQRIHALQRNCRHLSDLVDRFLELSKAESGMLEVELKKVSIRGILESMRETFELQASIKGLKFDVRSQGDLPELIVTDPVRLRQILMNLIANAIRFTSRGHVLVEASCDRSENHMSFRIEDTGVGMSSEQKARIFQPFSQGDGSTFRKFGGTGLGLHLSRIMARALGGDVTLKKTEQNGGTCFVARVQTNLKSQLYFEAGSEKEAVYANIEGVRVLVVEDTADIHEIVCDFLSRKEAIVELATSGRKAIELATSKNFDIILMDVQMPFMDGYETTKFLRAQKITIPIIALTAHASEDAKTRAMMAGCTGFLTKPVNFHKLAQVIFAETNCRGR